MKTISSVKNLFFALVIISSSSYSLQSQTYYFQDTVTCFSWDQPNLEWDSSYRNILSYTTFGKISISIDQNYSTSWLNSSKFERTYNSNQDIIKQDNYSWNGTSWDPTVRIVYFYDSNNKLINNSNLNWNGTAYDSSFRQLFTYDVNGFQNSITNQSYSSGWQNTFKIISINDANGNTTKQFNLTWDNINSEWDSLQLYIRTYNSSNLLLSEIAKNYDFITNQWQNQFKRENIYSTSNKLLQGINFSWNGTSWDSTFRIINTYDVNDNMLEQITQNYQGGVWNNQFRIDYDYNVSNNVIRKRNYNWNSGNWEPSSKDTTLYNSNELKEEYIYGMYLMGNYQHVQRCVYTYEAINFTSIQDQPYQTFGCVMPNPYSGQFVPCELKANKVYNITLFDTQGRVILQDRVDGGNQGFSLKTMPNVGLYIIQIQSEDGHDVFNKKLLINNSY